MLNLDRLREILEPAPARDPVDGLLEVAKAIGATPPDVAKRTTGGAERLPLDELQVDHDYQRPPDREKIAAFREHLRAHGSLPAIKVNRRPDGSHWIVDGQHRAAAAALEGHSHIDAHVTHKPSWEEPQDCEIVAKIAPERDRSVVRLLRGVGAERHGKRFVLNLGAAGQVSYTPQSEWVGKTERGILRVEAERAREVLQRLGLTELQPENPGTGAIPPGGRA